MAGCRVVLTEVLITCSDECHLLVSVGVVNMKDLDLYLARAYHLHCSQPILVIVFWVKGLVNSHWLCHAELVLAVVQCSWHLAPLAGCSSCLVYFAGYCPGAVGI
jgi:hypothetical protein